ncbi:DUF5691 domain-containing protein [Paenarthrobacter sp. NPDC089322]|uniref:DUF5691 domain-containing protein n=1 Tax=Paenarthrobacter sp. NPDC089322 TaxID=3155065 RepID=UPI00342A6A72
MTWFDELRTTALVGTGRHSPPQPPGELGVRPRTSQPTPQSNEESLLDQAALADVIRRSSRVAMPSVTALPPPAEPDTEPQADGEAARLLDLLLNQPPVGPDLRTQLVADWLRLAEKSRRRVPHRLLPVLFALAGTKSEIFRQLEPAIGTRGRWLWNLEPGHESAGQGAAGPHPVGAKASQGVPKMADAALARERLNIAWDDLSARERVRHLDSLSADLRADDEALLERALDDKAKGVREVAVGLLDRLPDSARAGRMADRLRPLLHFKGLLNKRVAIDLPPDPDAAALRDGLAPNPRTGEPDRLGRLETIVRGAPLEVWTTVSGRKPEAIAALLEEEPRILEALSAAVVARRDLAWVRALLTIRTDVRLLDCLPPPEREQYVVGHLRAEAGQPLALASLVQDLARPWGPDLSHAVLEMIGGKNGGLLARHLAGILPTALPPEATEQCRRMLERSDDDAARRRVLRDAVQYQSFRQTLTEAFQ